MSTIPATYAHMTRESWLGKAAGRIDWPPMIDDWIAGNRAPILTICGGVGAGKTHLGVAILQLYLGSEAPWGRAITYSSMPIDGDPSKRKRICAYFYHAMQLAEEARVNRYAEKPLRAEALRAPLVMVDDVAYNHDLTDLHVGTVCDLVAMAPQSGKSLILSTNMPARFLADPKKVDPKIYTRLAAGCIVDLDLPDFRVRRQVSA